MPAKTQPAATDVPRFEIARFGAALLHGAEEERADDQVALYKVKARFDEIAAFYTAIYGQQRGIIVDVQPEAEIVLVAVGKAVKHADFSTLTATPHPDDEPNRFRVMVMPRDEPGDGAGGEDEYPDSSPWAEPS